MLDRHPDGELAPRDIVAREVHQARRSGRGAFLDCRKAIGRDFAARFPALHAVCMEAGLDPSREPIPIAPAAHYHMGGVHVDGAGRSTLDGLWACGEVAATGAHGANCLAANPLLEAVVYAARVAEDIQSLLPRHGVTPWSGSSEGDVPSAPETDDETIHELRATMTANVGVVRDREGLGAALVTIARLAERARGPKARNALITAGLIASAALRREESRGSHFRNDFRASDPRWIKRTFLTLTEAEATARTATAPLELAS